MLLRLLVLITLLKVSNSKFVSTKNVYNGTMSYDGLEILCKKEFSKSVPCNRNNLLNGFWKYKLLPSWILTLDNNCLGYTTNSSNVMGTCIDTSFGYITDCSCSMKIPLCCYI